MAALISENYYLIPKKLRQNYAQPNRFLFVVTDLEKINENRDAMMEQFKLIKAEIKDLQSFIEK